MVDTLRCPRDGAVASLQHHRGRFGRFAVDVCPECAGVWFDRGEVGKLARNREVERLIVNYAGGHSGLACPRCGEEMAQRPVGQVTLDVCPNCKGIWADRGDFVPAVRGLGGQTIVTKSGLDFGRSLHARDLAYLAILSPRRYTSIVGRPGRKAARSRRI